MNRRLLFGSLLVSTFTCGQVQAVDSVHVVVASPVPNPLVVQNDLFIDFDFYLADQHLAVELTSGSIVYDTCPQCDPMDLDLNLLTSVFLGSPTSATGTVNVATMTATEWEVTWAPAPLSVIDQDNFHVARVFLSPDAQGSWSYQGQEVHPAAFLPAAPTIRGTILGGAMIAIPEPATSLLMLLVSAALVFCRP
jgi:hypothetical protein